MEGGVEKLGSILFVEGVGHGRIVVSAVLTVFIHVVPGFVILFFTFSSGLSSIFCRCSSQH